MITKRRSELIVDQVLPSLWRVISLRPDGTQTEYKVNPNSLSCDCPAGSYRLKCKHLDAVLSLLEGCPETQWKTSARQNDIESV